MRKSFLSLAIAASMAITSVSFADAEKPKKPADGDKPAKKEGGGGFKALDKNKDGKLSKEEVAGNKRLTENFAKIDANSDGSIDEAELKAAAPKKPDGGKKPGGDKKPKSE